MPSANITALTNLATPQPTMLMYAALSPFGPTDDRKVTANALFSTITANISDISVQFDDGAATATVSAAGKGKLRYNNTTKTFQASVDGGAYGTLGGGIGPVSAQSSSPVSVTTGDSGKVFTNEGAAGQITFNLPSAVANLFYVFIVQDVDGVKVVANTGDTIRLAGAVSASAGNITSTTIGSSVSIIAINATEWVAFALMGTWTVT